MKKVVPLTRSDFEEIISGDFYYVDKTLIIKELLDRKTGVTLITRPRRFGKTLNMSTMKYFFDIKNGDKNRELFRGLDIEKTEYMKEQGKYPVISLTMKDMKGITYEEFFEAFKIKIQELYGEYTYLRDSLEEWERMEFDKILFREDDAKYINSLNNLSKNLLKYHGIKPVLLIDEYDAPMLKADEMGYYEEVKELISAFYGSTLKDGVCSYAVVTGILKVAKESIFSTLNNLKVSTIFTGDYNHFGMTEEEVVDILKYYGWETTLQDTKYWYNGYLFGKERIYNPWSILSHCENGELKAFWVGTSANLLIKKILKNADREIIETMYTLVKDGRVLVNLDEDMIFGKEYSNSTLMYIMISSGYLTIEERGDSDEEYYLKIPNYEVKKYFAKTFKEIATSDSISSFLKLERALLKADIDLVGEIIEELFLKSISFLDLESEERFYHNIVLSMIAGIDGKFSVHSNRESGLGRYDLAIEPKDKKGTGYIFEFKAVSKKVRERIERDTTWENEELQEKKLQDVIESLGIEALSQIDRKIYDSEMKTRGISKIIKVGMVFCGKQVKLYTK